jgi:ubiquinone/menaquinone biosynthesis C-methylase UbiE
MNHSTTPHWGSDQVELSDRSLPSLKVRFVLDRLPDSGKVLEIGCGAGKVLRTTHAHKPGLELFGTDVSEPHVPASEFRFVLADASRLPFEDGSMDRVLVIDVLEHVPDPGLLLAEAARVVAPRGSLLAFVPIEGERFSFYELFRQILGRDIYAVTKHHIQAFTHDELARLVSDRFEITEMRYAYHLLGQAMDAGFFAAARLPSLSKFWWNDNVYYNGDKSSPGWATAALNGMLRAGNALAWAESTALASRRWGSCGVLLEARRRA